LVVDHALVSREHVEMCAALQQALRDAPDATARPLGEILVAKGLLERCQVEELLKRQKAPTTSTARPRTDRPERVPQPARGKSAAPPPATTTPSRWPRLGLRTALFVLGVVAVLLVIPALTAAWSSSPAKRTLADYLESCRSASQPPSAPLALGDMDIRVREFRIETVLPVVEHDYSKELLAYLIGPTMDDWQEMVDKVTMPADKRRALAAVVEGIQANGPPSSTRCLTISAQPIQCFLVYKRANSNSYREGRREFLVVNVRTTRWTSGWRVAGYRKVK